MWVHACVRACVLHPDQLPMNNPIKRRGNVRKRGYLSNEWRRGVGRKGGRRGWERSWSGKAISRRTVWSRSVYWLNDKYFGGKEKRVKLKKSRVFRMKQQDSGDLSHTDIHSHLYLEKLVHAMLRKQWMFSEGESYKCKNILRNKYCKKFSVLSVDPQTADYRKISMHYWIKMT